MNETCDRCGPAVAAVYRVERHGELYLCGHCANRLWAALFAQGWNIGPAGEHALAPQANECSGASWQRSWRGRGSGGSPRIFRSAFGAFARWCWCAGAGDHVAWSSAANPRKRS
jgi:ribosomal protein S27AE